jgi:hypothetical protein
LENVILTNADLTGAELARCLYIGHEEAAPATIAVDESRGGVLYVGMGSGALLRWQDLDLSTGPNTVLTTAPVIEMELVRGTPRIAAFTKAGLVIVNVSTGSTECQFSDATGYAPLYLPAFDGFVVQTPHGDDPDRPNTTLYDRHTMQEISRFDAPAIADLGYYAADIDRTLFDDHDHNLLVAESVSGEIEFILRGTVDLEAVFGSPNATMTYANSLVWAMVTALGQQFIAVFNLDGTLHRKITLTPLDPNNRLLFGFTGPRWGVCAGDLLIVTAGDSLRAFGPGSDEPVWQDTDAIGIEDIALLADGERFVSASSYGEIAIRSVPTGEVVSRTSTAQSYRGAKFSRDCAVPGPVLRALELGGAILVDPSPGGSPS